MVVCNFAIGHENLFALARNGQLFRQREEARRQFEGGRDAGALDPKREAAGKEQALEGNEEQGLRRSLDGGIAGGARSSFFIYGYDANGSTLTRTNGNATDRYEYDFARRLVVADLNTGDESSAVAYAYDADGLRVESIVDGDATSFLLDVNRRFAQVIEEASGGDVVSYTYGDDLVSMTRPALEGGVRYYHYDGQLSTRQLSDESGGVVDTYDYDAFGMLLASTGATVNLYRYTGEQYDPNVGFYYLRARYYAQDNGRFLTRDSYEGSTSDPATLHKYVYTHNDPVNNWDPSGESLLMNVMITVAIIAILSTIVAVMAGDWKAGVQFGLYMGAAVAMLAVAFTVNLGPAALFMGLLQAIAQMIIDGFNPAATTRTYWAVSFAKGFMIGVGSTLAVTYGGFDPALVAAAIAFFQQLVDAILTGNLNLKARITTIVVALVAGRLGAAAGSTQVTEIGKKIAAVLVRMDAFLIVNDLLAFIGGWGSGGGSHS